MTIKEMMEFLKKFDDNAEVIACNWEDISEVRVFDGQGLHQLSWKEEE